MIQYLLFGAMCIGTLYTAFKTQLKQDHLVILMNSFASLGIIGISFSSFLYSIKRSWKSMQITFRDFIRTLILSCAGLLGAAIFYYFIFH